MLYKSYRKKWFSHMEYEYEALRGNLTDVYAFATTHKVSTLPSDAVPYDVKDLKHV